MVCLDKLAPIGERIERSRKRLAMVPEPLRRSRVPERFWPPGQRWCSGCQSFVDRDDVTDSRCKPCASAASHGAAIQKTFGLTPAQYDQLLRLQDGKCAICRNRPKKKRLAVDHDHGTGAVRGLLCARCNHELLGNGHDSVAILRAAVTYMETPPASGAWTAPEATPAASPAPVEDEFESAGTPTRRPAASAPPVVAAARVKVSALPNLLDVPEEDRQAYSAGYWAAFGHRWGVDPNPPF